MTNTGVSSRSSCTSLAHHSTTTSVRDSWRRPSIHRKTALCYKTLNGARVGDLFMSIIHTAELAKLDVFGYLVAPQRHHELVADNPAAWMPWNYSSALARITGPAAPD